MKGFIEVTQLAGSFNMPYRAFLRVKDISGIMEGDNDEAEIIIGGQIIHVEESVIMVKSLINEASK